MKDSSKALWTEVQENLEREARNMESSEYANRANRKATKKALKKLGHHRTNATKVHFEQKRLKEAEERRKSKLLSSLPTAANFGVVDAEPQ